MPTQNNKTGSAAEFNANWENRKESLYNHWCADKPQNQIQFAFARHWDVFSELMRRAEPGTSLEVGCGRGSISSHFAEHGWDVTLLDHSQSVLDISRQIFAHNGHKATFLVGDANALPFLDRQFDAVVSIGLLEHFENVERPLEEQWRVLRPGGWLLAYIVPERPDNLQKWFNWLNTVLRLVVPPVLTKQDRPEQKEPIFRNDYTSAAYVPVLERLGAKAPFVSGMYSMPMVSHSPEFPFSLLPAPLEKVLVAIFFCAVKLRSLLMGRHGWLCSERAGQAFLVAAQKEPCEY
jgi:Methylase involved in ubiquinone/menaquinone biosynthesis